jgi:hypothetical protein
MGCTAWNKKSGTIEREVRETPSPMKVTLLLFLTAELRESQARFAVELVAGNKRNSRGSAKPQSKWPFYRGGTAA